MAHLAIRTALLRPPAAEPGQPPGVSGSSPRAYLWCGPLLLVVFDFGHRAVVHHGRVLTELAAGPALPQQIPGLVKGVFDALELCVLLSRGQFSGGQLATELVLGSHELIDTGEDLLVVHESTVRFPVALRAPGAD